jgi:hypothetical protein
MNLIKEHHLPMDRFAMTDLRAYAEKEGFLVIGWPEGATWSLMTREEMTEITTKVRRKNLGRRK